jgi:LuxR family maltose regulon positive regulatory protein
MQSSQSMGNYLIALLSAYILGYQQNLQGKLSQAEETFRNAIRMAESGFQSRESPVFGVIYIGLADLLRERNQIEAAAKSIDKGLQLGREFNNAEMLVDVLVVQARVQQALGLVESASRTMQQACQLYLDGQVAIWTGRQVATYQARLNIQQNNLEAAWRWADGLLSADYQANSPTGGFSKYVDTYVFCMEGVVLARLNLAAGRAAEAEKWLYEVLRRAASIEWRVCQIEAKALLALAFQAQNKSHVAIQMLQEALQEAAPEGYIRLFIDIGQPMRALLRTVYPQLEPGRLADFAQVLLEAFVKEPAGVSQPEPVADYTNKL